jgi:hypothetical protein
MLPRSLFRWRRAGHGKHASKHEAKWVDLDTARVDSSGEPSPVTMSQNARWPVLRRRNKHKRACTVDVGCVASTAKDTPSKLEVEYVQHPHDKESVPVNIVLEHGAKPQVSTCRMLGHYGLKVLPYAGRFRWR